jgi:hypothetical protein
MKKHVAKMAKNPSLNLRRKEKPLKHMTLDYAVQKASN